MQLTIPGITPGFLSGLFDFYLQTCRLTREEMIFIEVGFGKDGKTGIYAEHYVEDGDDRASWCFPDADEPLRGWVDLMDEDREYWAEEYLRTRRTRHVSQDILERRTA